MHPPRKTRLRVWLRRLLIAIGIAVPLLILAIVFWQYWPSEIPEARVVARYPNAEIIDAGTDGYLVAPRVRPRSVLNRTLTFYTYLIITN